MSELVQLKLNIGASDGDSSPSEEKRGTPTYRSGGLKKLDKEAPFVVKGASNYEGTQIIFILVGLIANQG